MLRRPRGFFFFEEDTDISKPNGSEAAINSPFLFKADSIGFPQVI
jgi:hypothetical protein